MVVNFDVRGQQEIYFFSGGSENIMDYGLVFWLEVTVSGLKAFMMDLFLTNMQFFTSQVINWWTGLVWIIVMFLSAVWTLILTAPIHYRGSIVEQVMQCYISPNLFWWTKKLIYILDGKGEQMSN